LGGGLLWFTQNSFHHVEVFLETVWKVVPHIHDKLENCLMWS
jgi:hypothetical protein